VLFRHSKLPGADEADEDSGEDEDEEEASLSQDEDAPEDKENDEMEQEEGAEPDATEGDNDSGDDTHVMVRYVLNIGFGNEALDSNTRLTLLAPERLCACLDWLCSLQYGKDAFTMSDMARADAVTSNDELKKGILEAVVQILITHGFLSATT